MYGGSGKPLKNILNISLTFGKFDSCYKIITANRVNKLKRKYPSLTKLVFIDFSLGVKGQLILVKYLSIDYSDSV